MPDLAVKDRAQLVLENAVLRRQLAVLKRSVSRPKIDDSDRMVSKSKSGRPLIGMSVILLIRRMSEENPTWGAPRIVDELALLGHEMGETTVAK